MALHPVNILSFCSGIGGLDLGLKRAIGPRARVVAHVEGEMYAAAVLAARMQDGAIHDAPIWSDVKTFDAAAWRGCVDIITAGYPCQPFSAAGKRRGADDPRHLWPYIAAHIRAIRPATVFCENVPGHLSLGFEQVCQDLSAMGYAIEAGIFSAAEIGAPHLRKRLFFIAYVARSGLTAYASDPLQTESLSRQKFVAPANSAANVANTDSIRREQGWPEATIQCGRDGVDGGSARCTEMAHADSDRQRRVWSSQLEADDNYSPRSSDVAEACVAEIFYPAQKHVCQAQSFIGKHGKDAKREAAQRRLGGAFTRSTFVMDHNSWTDGWEDGIPRVATGQSHRVDRLRALGNAVVPGVATLAWNTLVHQALSRATIPHAQVENAVST